MMEWIKALHVLLATTIFGLSVASFFYAARSRKDDVALQRFTLKLALQLEQYGLVPGLVVLVITGSLLVPWAGFSYRTPWILMAYAGTFLLLCLRMWMLRHATHVYRACLAGKPHPSSRWHRAAPFLFWGIMLLVMRDALTQSTFWHF